MKFLIDWINTTLKHEHIVVRSLEHDLYDGLVLHHLLEELGSVTLEVEKIALTEKKQQLKLTIILETVNQLLHLDENELKWSVNAIFKKDLLSTLHLLVAIAEHFQPDLAMPSNVKVDVINIEVLLKFVNKHVEKLGLSINNVDSQVHNVNFALELLMEEGLLDTPINPEDVVNRDLNATLLILYCLYSKYKTKGHEKQK
ncbi:hypothetical protein JRQ81_015639 [Phrynocephalus forsythii]|uniref:Calponin-homology (CH) domain-containing protein n=1 Tax=Phrynocephalus forsythii TaxID=171643 RepID=A0A9Q1B1Y2_9SAUR|nr:hypothetical protein JRQ81_015639 [Phrynocephalus forsythii]